MRMKKYWKGLILCLLITIPSWVAGKIFPVVGSPIIAILMGMAAAVLIRDKARFEDGVGFASKKILQWAVILLGAGMDLRLVFFTGVQSLPIIICTIFVSLCTAFVLCRVLHVPKKSSILIGVGSSICGGSAIAATAPVIDADDEEVAQAISVIFLFNVLAALLFPALGSVLGFDTTSGEAFGIFAGTAVNDTSSVTACASTWDSMWNLGTQTLDKAITVKLTRTLAIIPITLALALLRVKNGDEKEKAAKRITIRQVFPMFILYFVCASVITTLCLYSGIPSGTFAPFKEMSKFMITFAMSAIGFHTDIGKLIRTGGKPVMLGAACWGGIIIASLTMQHVMGIW